MGIVAAGPGDGYVCVAMLEMVGLTTISLPPLRHAALSRDSH